MKQTIRVLIGDLLWSLDLTTFGHSPARCCSLLKFIQQTSAINLLIELFPRNYMCALITGSECLSNIFVFICFLVGIPFLNLWLH